MLSIANVQLMPFYSKARSPAKFMPGSLSFLIDKQLMIDWRFTQRTT